MFLRSVRHLRTTVKLAMRSSHSTVQARVRHCATIFGQKFCAFLINLCEIGSTDYFKAQRRFFNCLYTCIFVVLYSSSPFLKYVFLNFKNFAFHIPPTSVAIMVVRISIMT